MQWPQQPGGKERRDYWDRRAVKEREDAGLDYLRGNAKRYKGVGDVYYALSRCLILVGACRRSGEVEGWGLLALPGGCCM